MSPVEVGLLGMIALSILIAMSIPTQPDASTVFRALMTLFGPYLMMLLGICMIAVSLVSQPTWTLAYVIAGIATFLFGLVDHERRSFNLG